MTRFHLLYMVVLYERVTNNKLLCLFVCLYKSVSYGFSLQFMQRHLHMFAYTDRRTDRRRRRQIYSHWILCISTSWHSGLHLDSLIFFCCFFFSLLHFAVTYKRFRNVFFSSLIVYLLLLLCAIHSKAATLNGCSCESAKIISNNALQRCCTSILMCMYAVHVCVCARSGYWIIL